MPAPARKSESCRRGCDAVSVESWQTYLRQVLPSACGEELAGGHYLPPTLAPR